MSDSFATAAPPPPSRARIWWDASRPRTLPAAAAPVVLGTAVAAHLGEWAPLPATAALVGALLIQIGTNFANDVFDAEKGADRPDRLGPVRAVAAGLVSRAAMRRAMWLTFVLAMSVGAYLVAVGGWPIVLVGLGSIAAGILYTGGPWPLGYHGLGELFVFLFFGLVAVTGTVYVQTGELPVLAWLCAVPAGLLCAAVLVVNNLRDREQDARAGKRTLAVMLGANAARLEYAALVSLPYLCSAAIAAYVGSPWPLLTAALAPRSFQLAGWVRTRDGRALNPLLGSTGGLLLAYSALLGSSLLMPWR